MEQSDNIAGILCQPRQLQVMLTVKIACLRAGIFQFWDVFRFLRIFRTK